MSGSVRSRTDRDFWVHCHYCREAFPHYDITKDHIVPKSRGGRNHISNYVPACHDCNRRKGSNTPTCPCPTCRRAVLAHGKYVRSLMPEVKRRLLARAGDMFTHYGVLSTTFKVPGEPYFEGKTRQQFLEALLATHEVPNPRRVVKIMEDSGFLDKIL